MADHIDLIILGSGSTAFAAALRAREFGKTAVMTEARSVGGTCVNRGCLPSKNLIEAARLLHEARHPRYPGLTPCEMTCDFQALIAQKDDVIHEYRKHKYEGLLGSGIDLEQGPAQFVDDHTVTVGSQALVGDHILIATGSRPVIPDIDGLADVPYLTSDLLTSDEPLELKDLPTSLLIVGGGYIALELGQMFRRFGTEVTLVERSAQLLPRRYEPEVGLAVAEMFAEKGIRVATQASLTRVREDSGGVVASARVRGQEEVEVDAFLRTNVPYIFAAGDVIGREAGSQMATPVGSRDGGIAASNALSDGPMKRVDHRIIPRVIFTDPQVAVVGLTEEAAVSAGHRCWCRTLPMSLVPRAGAIRKTQGLIKMVADATTGEVLGVSMVGESAGEAIHEAAMALHFRATLQDFIDLVHVYPTMAEALKIVAMSRFKDSGKLSCCAE